MMFHGNGGNVGHRIPLARVFYYKMRCNVLMVSYRGYVTNISCRLVVLNMILRYGLSEGSPNEKGEHNVRVVLYTQIHISRIARVEDGRTGCSRLCQGPSSSRTITSRMLYLYDPVFHTLTRPCRSSTVNPSVALFRSISLAGIRSLYVDPQRVPSF